MTQSLTETLLRQLKIKTINPQDRERAALHLIDWLGCCALAKKSEVAQTLMAYIADEKIESTANQPSTHVVFGEACYWQDALLINGALGNVLEMDDIHRSSILHPGPVVIPAALVIAQKYQLSVQKLLEAIVLGYEITIRLGESIGRSHYQYFHNTATCAGFGAALAVSHLLDLSDQQTLSALGNVGSRTGGLWQMRNEKVMTKQWHNADAARAGAMAALLAKQGLTGPEFILEGPQGVFNALSDDADPQAFIKPSDSWRMYDCSFKPWPACRHAHPAIDATLAAIKQFGDAIPFDVTQVKQVIIKTYADAKVFCDRVTPETELQAKFSIQHAVAALLSWGEPQLEHYKTDTFAALANLRSKISVIEDADFEHCYPQHYGACAEITLTSGEVVTANVKDTLGDPERPLTTAQLKSKAQVLMSVAGVNTKTIKDILSMDWVEQSHIYNLSQLIKSPSGSCNESN